MVMMDVLHDIYLFSDVFEFCWIFVHFEFLIYFYCEKLLLLILNILLFLFFRQDYLFSAIFISIATGKLLLSLQFYILLC